MALRLLVDCLLFILPAYVANGTPVIVSKLVGRGHPMDFGKRFIDGRRLLGDGKTFEGFASGVLAAIIISLILAAFGDTSALLRGPLLGLGAMLGDLAGSFIKRRLGLPRGAPAPLLDQLDFLVGALALAYLAGFKLPFEGVLLILIITPLLHLLTNALAYLLGLKQVPW